MICCCCRSCSSCCWRTVFLLLAWIFLSKGNGDIKIQPTGEVLTRIGSVVNFNCTKGASGMSFGWRVFTSACTEGMFVESGSNKSLVHLGVILAYHSETLAILSLRVAKDKVIALQCQYYDKQKGKVIPSQKVDLFIVAPPPRPTELMVRLLKGNSLAVTWTFPNVSIKTLDFVVALTTAQGTRRAEVNATTTRFEFSLSQQTSCQRFGVAVMARNLASQKEASTSVVLPGAPDDVCHQIIATKDGYALLTKFEMPKCSVEYNVRHQLSVLPLTVNGTAASGGSETDCMADLNGRFRCEHVLPPGGMLFNFSIVSHTEIGRMDTAPLTASSRNLQEAFLVDEEDNNMYTVVCRFLSDSDIRGCKYVLLVGGDGGNVSGVILREEGNAAAASSAKITAPGNSSFTELIAYEISSSGEVIDDQYPFRTRDIFRERRPSICKDKSEVTTTVNSSTDGLGLDAKAGIKTTLLIIVCPVVGFIALVVVISLMLTLGIVLARKKLHWVKKELHTNLQIEGTQEDHYETLQNFHKDNHLKPSAPSDDTYAMAYHPEDQKPVFSVYHTLESCKQSEPKARESPSPYANVNDVTTRGSSFRPESSSSSRTSVSARGSGYVLGPAAVDSGRYSVV